MDWQKGKIIGFKGSWGSGIAFLLIEDQDGMADRIPCDNAPTGRALDAMFNCIGEGHCIDNSKIEGQEIRYLVDEIGLLTQLAFPE